MFRRILVVLAAVAALATSVLTESASAQRRPGPGRWVVLGEQSVGFTVDRDRVVVGRDEGWIRTIRLSAKGNDVRLLNVRIVYQNGYTEDFRNEGILRRNGRPVVIDLRGERSFLREIELTYRTRPNFQGRATVVVEGQVLRPR